MPPTREVNCRTSSNRARARLRDGFSLVEAMIAISIMAIAGGAIMLGLTGAVKATSESLDSAIATGIAQQIIDEVAGRLYAARGAGPYQTALTASAWEKAGQGRERFNDTDDYNSFVAQPVEGVWGVELGQGDAQGGLRHTSFRLPQGYLADWREEIEVYYVDATDHSVRLAGNVTSDFRCIEVRIYRDQANGTRRELANLKRVYAYVPPPD